MLKLKKNVIIVFCLFLFGATLYSQDTKDIQVETTKFDAFASKTGTIIKFIDYTLPNLNLAFGGIADVKIRKFICDSEEEYFLQISYEGKYKTKTASIAYEDLIEVLKAITTLKNESSSDLALNSDYLENKFVTEDGFQAGYYIISGKISWYLTLEKFGSGNTIFPKNVSSIETMFTNAKSEIEILNI